MEFLWRILYLLLIQVMISTRSSTINYKRRVILVCVVNQNLAVVIVVNKTLIILLLLLISWDLTVCVVLARHRGCVCNRRTNDLLLGLIRRLLRLCRAQIMRLCHRSTILVWAVWSVICRHLWMDVISTGVGIHVFRGREKTASYPSLFT